jgi:trans-2,3-dihydro-3-hydroxyanthranilate isomerase
MSLSNLFHVDVFAAGPITGNGLTVFLNTENWSSATMLKLTQEMKQFESIFLSEISPLGAIARVFTVEEELPFAGHPVLGAAAVLHRTQMPHSKTASWVLKLPSGSLSVNTQQMDNYYVCEMNQGKPSFGQSIDEENIRPFLARLSLDAVDVVSGMSAQVISTGLPYLIIPVTENGLSRAKIVGTDLEALLNTIGAKFILVLNTEEKELRTWDNLGHVEDVATGSAAGPAAAYLIDKGLIDQSHRLELAQGKYVGRPSKIVVVQDEGGNLLVRGDVWPVSQGMLEVNVFATDG